LHIGGARTALFNWLFARHTGGKFLLRIEDTDQARSTPEATEAIFAGLRWLGLDWDGEAVSQASRIARHAEVAHEMLGRGTAYRCFATVEEIEAFRESARAAGRAPLFRSPWRDADRATWPDMAYVVRLKAPREGETVVEDEVQGTISWQNDTLDDLILLRSDGTPTYMHAVVVDDHDMGVTHIIRGDDHLTNAGRQTLLYQALGWQVPVMAHIPLIHGADGAKLSKRHGALGADAYRAMGYLPEALRNYLVRLGWSHGDDEIMSNEQMIEWFGFEGMGRGAARFDIVKLEALNGHYIRHAEDAYLVSRILDLLNYIEDGSRIAAKFTPLRRQQLLAAMPGLKERAKTLVELLDGAQFLLAERPLAMDAKAAEILADGGHAIIGELIPQLEAVTEWTAGTTEATVRAHAEQRALKLGNVAQPLRAALTGRLTSPPVFDVLAVLGRDESLARLRDQKR
jgi:glutamyl-tRNA synthetase